MQGLKRIFGGLNRAYMIRAYLIAALFFALIVTLTLQGNKANSERAIIFTYFGLCVLLFPFAKLVWDALKGLVFGETIFILPVLFLYPAKLVVNLFLYCFALFVAPFGMIYIWFQTR